MRTGVVLENGVMMKRYWAEVVESFQFCGQGAVSVSARDIAIRVPSNKLDDIW